MDREMLLVMVRRGNLRVRPWRTCIEVDQVERTIAWHHAVRAGEGVDRGGWLQ